MIVAGVDGSRASLVAVAWAVREAAMRGVTVRLVHVMPGLDSSAGASCRQVRRWLRKHAMVVVTDALRHARREEGEVEADAQVLTGDPRLGLVRASKDAELLVVGSHGTGGFWEQVAGSVALGVPGQANCPVVVVRAPPEQSRNEVVVGVDGSAGGRAATDFAFAEAALRGAELHAVHAWSPVSDGRAAKGPTREAGRRLLAETVADFRARYPGVKLVTRSICGHPVDVLLRASAGAGLLVVGSRGRGPVTAFFGSVSHALVQYAACPLVVVAVADEEWPVVYGEAE